MAHAKFTTFGGLVVTVDILDKDGNGWLRLTASGEGAAAAQASELNAKLSPWVYVVSSYKAKTLQTKLADLLEPQKPS